MSVFSCRRRSGAGFTVIETVAALAIFSLVTIGVVPVIMSSLAASGLSRSQAVADGVARAAMERLSGIRFYTSYDAKPAPVDLLDLYFPKASSSGLLAGQSYSTTEANPPLTASPGGSTGVFTTTCPDTNNPACPRDIPAGHTLVFKATFVEPVTTTTPQTYRMVTPPTTYAWDSSGFDKPPSDLLDVGVTDSWTYGGRTRSVRLRSIIGERSYSPAAAVDAVGGPAPSPPPAPSGTVRVQGEARLDYALQGTTGYVTNSTGGVCTAEPCNRSDLIFAVGKGNARIETKDLSTADVWMRYAEGRIVRSYPPGTTPPESPPPDLANLTGAYAEMHAPPSSSVATGPTLIGTRYMTHPENSTNQARIYDHQLAGMKADVSSEIPTAESYFQVPSSAAAADVWMNNSQRDTSSEGPMHLDVTYPVFYTVRWGVTPPTPNGYVKAVTGALGSPDRRVQTTSYVNLPGFYFYRIYAGRSGKEAYNPLLFYNFKAAADCKSTANPATADASATWSVDATMQYDNSNNGATTSDGSYTFTLRAGPDILNGATVTDAIAQLKTANPLLYDGASVCCSSTSDIYMFETRDASGNLTKRGYFTDWTQLDNPIATESSDGRTTTASIDGALRIETASLRQTMSPDLPDSAEAMSFGNMSCSAVDNR